MRRRKKATWYQPSMRRRSSSRNSEPPHISPVTYQATRPAMAFRSQSLRIPSKPGSFSFLEPHSSIPGSTINIAERTNSPILIDRRPLSPMSPTPPILSATPATPASSPPPLHPPITCIAPVVAVVNSAQTVAGIEPGPAVISPRERLPQPAAPIVFQAAPSTLAVPTLVGRTQAVAASKKAFLQVKDKCLR